MDVRTAVILSCILGLISFHEVESTFCGFEDGNACGWVNVNFKVSRFETPLANSGPKTAFQGEYYAYFYGNETVTDAILEIPNANGGCLFFAFHMWGSQMGSLWVNVTTEEGVQPLLVKEGNQGNEWHCVGIALPINPLSTINIHARRGGISSIFGIDNILIFDPLLDSCDVINCTFAPSQIRSTTQMSISPSITNSVNTMAGAPTTQTPDFFTENLPLITGVPGGLVFLIIIAGIFIVVCRKKEKETFPENMMSDQVLQNARTNNRYRSFPHNHQHVEEEVYDEIKEGPEYSYADTYDTHKPLDDEYLKPIEKNAYLELLTTKTEKNNRTLSDKYKENVEEEGYTILPAITLPMSTVNEARSHENEGYVDQKDLNIPNRPGKKISISDQGNVTYCDIRSTTEQKQNIALSRTYLSLSHM
ncbi:uncharacterized protein LOC134280307 [Saccostrea cucullata]|uniref:uncharacterized protein LOC134280307 n=1 Tax=Saccostrea cuccullata TaxID=36930 RepID=UPI002ED4B977